MTGRAKLAVLGGTFDHLHAGHWRLLDTAFAQAREVGIGVTTDRYLTRHPKAGTQRLESYGRRRRQLETQLRARYPSRRWWTVALEDGVGGALAPEVDLLVASADTRSGALGIQRERKRLGLPALRVVSVPLLTADDLRPLSSTRIRLGIIRADGTRVRPISLACQRSLAPEHSSRLEVEVRRIFPRGTTLRWERRSRPQVRPAKEGSTQRRAAEIALVLCQRADYGFGVVVPPHARGREVDPTVVVADADGPIGGPGSHRSPGTIEASLRTQFRQRKRRWVGSSRP